MPYAPKQPTPKRVKVSQATIDKIKKLGMTAALKKAGSSNNAEYIEGIRRMYGQKRLSAARGNRAAAPAPRTSRTTGTAKSSLMPLPRTSRTKGTMINLPRGTKPPAGKLPYYYTENEKAYVKAFGKPKSSKKTTSSSTKPTKSQIAYGRARAGGSR